MRVAVVLRKLETLKMETLAVLAVTVQHQAFLAHQLLTLVAVVVGLAVALLLKLEGLEVVAAAVLAAE